MASFTVKISKLNAAISATSPDAFRADAGEAVEEYIDKASSAFKDAVKVHTPVRTGKMRRSVRCAVKRAGVDSTARVRVGSSIAPIIEHGAKPHLIPGPVMIGGQVYVNVHHPGFRANPFFANQLAEVDGIVKPLAKKAGFATADKMLARIAKGR